MYGNMYGNENGPQQTQPPQPNPPKKPVSSTAVIIALIAGISAIICVRIFPAVLPNIKNIPVETVSP